MAIIDFKRFFDRTVGENDQGVGIGIVLYIGIVQNDYGIYSVRDKVAFTLFGRLDFRKNQEGVDLFWEKAWVAKYTLFGQFTGKHEALTGYIDWHQCAMTSNMGL